MNTLLRTICFLIIMGLVGWLCYFFNNGWAAFVAIIGYESIIAVIDSVAPRNVQNTVTVVEDEDEYDPFGD